MSTNPSDPTVETHPLLFAVVQQHVEYYREAREYASKAHISADLQKDSQFRQILEESGINPDHPNALRAFRRVLWPVMRSYMNSRTGWWARTYGKNASFFHETWGTVEDGRDAINKRLQDSDKDEAAMQRLYAITQEKCVQLGWSFDPQYDDAGALCRVEVWKAAA